VNVKSILPALAGVFTAAIVFLAARYASLFSTVLFVPNWLWAFLLGSALESAYFAAYFLTPRTPFTVRLVELALWLGPIYLLVGRSPSAFLWPACLTAVCWLLARGCGLELSRLEKVADLIGDQGASTVSWEYESLTSMGQDELALGFFWRRVIACAAAVVVLAVAAHRREVKAAGALLLELRLAGGTAAASGLALLGGAYLFRLQTLWACAKAAVDPALPREWLRNLAIIVALSLALVYLAPIDYSPVTADTVGRLLAAVLSRGVELPELPKAAPEERPSFSQSGDPLPEVDSVGLGGIILTAMYLLLVALVSAVLLAALGFILFELTKGEIERLRGLPRLAVQVYAAVRRAVLQVLAALGRLKSIKPIKGQAIFPGQGEERPSEPSADRDSPPERGVRALLLQIARQAGKKGLVFRRSQTPWEYGQALRGQFFPNEEVVGEFFQGYQRARYSRSGLSGAEEERVLAAGTQILNRVREWKGDEKDG
jgi:hypothetical protein